MSANIFSQVPDHSPQFPGHRMLTSTELDIWYYAYCHVRYQNRPLHRPEVCAIIGDLLKLPIPSEDRQHYTIFDNFDDPEDNISKFHRKRCRGHEAEFKTRVLDALQRYLDKDATGRDRATVFGEIPERPVYPNLAIHYRHWDKDWSNVILMDAYQHIPLYIIATECKNADGSAADEETRCKTAGICLMENEDGSYEKCGAKHMEWLTTPNHEYARAMANLINPHRNQYSKNTQNLLDRYKAKLRAAGLEVYIVPTPPQETTEAGSSSGQTASRPGPNYSHNILKTPSPGEKGKEKETRGRDSSSGSPGNKGSKKPEEKKQRREGKK